MYTLKKSLGQHFLHDEGICQRIVAAMDYKPGLQLLEVGPGGGALTKYLLGKEDIHYHAVEVDREKVEYLRESFPAIKGKISEEDILTARLPFEGHFSIIGNFPYNISSPILFRVLEWEEQVDEVVGMFQKEVAHRIASPAGTRDGGILSILMQAFFKVEYLFDVPPTAFTPPPKVDSSVLRFTSLRNPHGIANKRTFTRLVKAAFSQRRKTLRNALKGTLQPEALAADPRMTLRAEQLKVADFVDLMRQYMPA